MQLRCSTSATYLSCEAWLSPEASAAVFVMSAYYDDVSSKAASSSREAPSRKQREGELPAVMPLCRVW